MHEFAGAGVSVSILHKVIPVAKRETAGLFKRLT